MTLKSGQAVNSLGWEVGFWSITDNMFEGKLRAWAGQAEYSSDWSK